MDVKRRDVGWLGGFASRSRGFDEIRPGAVDEASTEPTRLFDRRDDRAAASSGGAVTGTGGVSGRRERVLSIG